MLRDIGGRPVGAGAPVFVIAEIGLNHSGSLDRALEMVDAAAWAGASAIKLQTLRADALVAATCPPPAHVRVDSLRAFFAAFELDEPAHHAIVRRARDRGLAVMATPFALDLIPMLMRAGIDAFKIASGDLTFDALIAAAAATRRPLVISTGMGTLPEVDRAAAVARAAGADSMAALHCVSAYPTPVESRNLRAIPTLATHLGVPVGLSDHSDGPLAALGAVALGAVLYERHLVLDGDDQAIDGPVSSTPSQLELVISQMDELRRSLGDGRKVPQAAEQANVTPSRRGLYAVRRLPPGTRIAAADVDVVRPASALAPAALDALIGSVVRREIPAGAPFEPCDLATTMERAS